MAETFWRPNRRLGKLPGPTEDHSKLSARGLMEDHREQSAWVPAGTNGRCRPGSQQGPQGTVSLGPGSRRKFTRRCRRGSQRRTTGSKGPTGTTGLRPRGWDRLGFWPGNRNQCWLGCWLGAPTRYWQEHWLRSRNTRCLNRRLRTTGLGSRQVRFRGVRQQRQRNPQAEQNREPEVKEPGCCRERHFTGGRVPCRPTRFPRMETFWGWQVLEWTGS